MDVRDFIVEKYEAGFNLYSNQILMALLAQFPIIEITEALIDEIKTHNNFIKVMEEKTLALQKQVNKLTEGSTP